MRPTSTRTAGEVAGVLVVCLLTTQLWAQDDAPPAQELPAHAAARGVENGDGDQDTPLFIERPGEYEFSGRLIARPKSIDAWMEEGLTRPQARARIDTARDRLVPLSLHIYPEVDEYILQVPAGGDENRLARGLLATRDYDYIEPDWLVHAVAVPNDPLYNSQWHLPAINAPGAWDTTTGDPGIVIAICDSGIDTDHPDLAAALVPGYNAVDQLAQENGGQVEGLTDHGSQVGGSAGAVGNNATGISGVGWNLSLMPVRVSNLPNNTAFISDILHGARWAVENGAKIANVSFSGVHNSSVGTTGEFIRSIGGMLVWSAGNSSADLGLVDHQAVLIVGAVNQSLTRASFSNFGRGIDLVAPGVDILTTQLNGAYGVISGTSFSAPISAGVAGLVWSVNPGLEPLAVEVVLAETALDLGDPGEDNIFGAGMVDADQAVQLALAAKNTPLAPRANDDSGASFDDNELLLDVLSNDIDLNGQVITITSFDTIGTAGGSVERSVGSGSGGRDELRYVGRVGFEGFDTFTYTVEDPGGLAAIATVRIARARGLPTLVPTTYPTIIGPTGIETGDVNNDGWLDIVVAKATSFQTFQILLNDGAGSFTETSVFGVPSGAQHFTLTDLNHDDFDDIAYTNGIFGTFGVVLSNGDGTFATAMATSFNRPGPITAVDANGSSFDLNGDSHPDLVIVGTLASLDVTVMLGDGTGGFTSGAVAQTAISPQNIVAADFDGDTDIDFVTGNIGTSSISFIENLGGGALAAAVDTVIGISPRDIHAADIDGNGRIDLALVTEGLLGEIPGVLVVTNDGDANFSVREFIDSGGENPKWLRFGDIDADGDPDLVSLHQNSHTVGLHVNFLPDQFFPLPIIVDSAGSVPSALAVGDFNSDGSDDIVALNGSIVHNVAVFLTTPVGGSSQPAMLTDVTRTLGVYVSGGVAELLASDDAYYVLQSGPGFDPSEPHPARADFRFDSLGFPASTLDITLEEKANIGGPTAVLLLRNWNTTQWDELNRYALSPVDQTFTLSDIPATDYVNGADRIEVRVRSFAILILNPTVRGIFSHDFVRVTLRE